MLAAGCYPALCAALPRRGQQAPGGAAEDAARRVGAAVQHLARAQADLHAADRAARPPSGAEREPPRRPARAPAAVESKMVG